MSETLSITVKSSGDTKYQVEVSSSITVLELKNEIAEKSSIPTDRQRLIYSGKVLKDSEVLSTYKIQSGHTIHLVKSAGSKPASTSEAQSTTNSTATENASSSGVPSNIAAGQGSFNPLEDLTGARYAGYTQLPSASMFGPDGGMNSGMPDPEQLSQMMSNPMFQESLNAMLSNPQMIDFMINQNPQLRAMGPQVREMLQSPFIRQMMANPEMMRSMMEMSRNSGMGSQFGGANAGGSFPAPGVNPTVGSGNSDSTTSGEQAPSSNATGSTTGNNNANTANPFASLFPNGAPPIDPFSLFGGAGVGANPPADNRPPEERYETQLRQLNDMGFFEFERNVEALRRTGGSVQGAIEYLLNN